MTTDEKRRLALRWAPIHYQAISPDNAKADFITRVNFAGTWKTSGNWDALDRGHPLTGAAYYSVTETDSHWYIIYVFYHARDWDNISQHENDLEGFLTIIQRPVNRYLQKSYPDGIFLGMISCAHVDFYSYSNVLGKNREGVDGKIKFEKGLDNNLHPCTFQEALGHGCKIYKHQRYPYVRYVPTVDSSLLTQPDNIVPRDRMAVKPGYYELIDMHETDGFWKRRWSAPVNEPFAVGGPLKGDKHGKNAANPPWRWDDHNDGPDLGRGIMAYDPAYIAWEYFSGFMYSDLDKFYNYTDMPFTVPGGSIYGQPVDNALLDRYLNSSDKFESLCAAGLKLLSNTADKKTAEVMTRALQDGELSFETLALIKNYALAGSPFAGDLAQSIMGELANRLSQIKPDRIPGMIKALQLLNAGQARDLLANIYVSSHDNHIVAAAAKYLAGFPKIGNARLTQSIIKNMTNSPDSFVREASGRLYLNWHLEDNPDRLFHFVDDEHPNLALIAADACRRMASDDPLTTMDILNKLLKSKAWNVRALAASVLAEKFEDHGLEVISRVLKKEYDYSRRLISDNTYNPAGDFSACPGRDKEFGQLYLITSLAETMST